MSLFELGEIEALAQAKGSIFLMVSNGSSIYPYDGSTDVKLEVKLDGVFEGITSYETTFHGVLYNQTYELDFKVSIRGTAPFQVVTAQILSMLVIRVTTPPIDVTTYVPGKEQVDRYTVTVTYSNLKPGPKSSTWPAGMRLRAGFDTVSAMVEGAATQSREYAVVRGGSAVSGGFLTDLLWPEGNSTQGGAETPISFTFTPKN
jgi:hypothetical protein